LEPADIKHILVTSQTTIGPYTTTEIIDLFKEKHELFNTVMWIAPECGSPVLIVEWFTDYTPSGTLEEILASDVPKDQHANFRETPTGKKAELPPDHGGLTPAQAQRGRFASLRDVFALVVLAILGLGLLWMGIKTMRPAKILNPLEKKLAAKLLGSTPDALRNYQNLLEGKITRDGQKYARALVSIQKDRALYPEGYLPSGELTAALALVNLTHEELDRMEEWKQLLVRLPAEMRQRGLAVVAYELSRVFAIRRDLLKVQGKSKSVRAKAVREAGEEIDVILERLIRVVPQSEPEERVLHGLLLSRLLSLSFVTLLENPQMFNETQRLKTHLEKIPALNAYLSSADTAITGELLDALKIKSSNAKMKIDWSKPIARLVELHSSNRFLCNLNESGAAGDTLLFLIESAAGAKQTLPSPTNLFDGCFVGLRLYPRVSGFSLNAGVSDPLLYVTAGAVDDGLLMKFRTRFPTYSQALSTLGGQRTANGEWLLALYQNRILKGRMTGAKTKDTVALCGKAAARSPLCGQVLWNELSHRWRDLITLVPDMREDVRPDEAVLLSQNYIFNAATEVLSSRSVQKVKEFNEAFTAVKDFVDKEDPQIQFLLDYIQSIDLDS
jgi:hypothetical protein